MKTFSGIEFASEHNGTDVFRLIELAYEQGQKDGHSEQLGTNLAEVGTDLISRQQAIDALLAWMNDPEDDRNSAFDVLKQLPSAQPKLLQPWEVLVAQAVLLQPKRGKWICTGSPDESWGMMYECSICGNHDYGGNYCSYCGAKMEDSEDETD